jgi:hypothetical protein
MALELEDSSKNGDFAFCSERTGALREAMLKLKERLSLTSLMTSIAPEAPKEVVGSQRLIVVLKELNAACNSGVLNEVQEKSSALKSLRHSEEVDAELKGIIELVESYDFDEAAEKSEALVNALK